MTYRQLWQRLSAVYGDGEAKAMARLIYEERYGLSLSDLLAGRDADVPQEELEQITRRLEDHEPVQYILGQTDFCNRTFWVDEHVLIPRPETAELCRWIVQEVGGKSPLRAPCTILDIGTGSGCIAVTLGAEPPAAKVPAWDISEDALQVARKNASRHNVQIAFQQVDILNPQHFLTVGQRVALQSTFNVIVSNPPYICYKEQVAMDANVLEYEPYEALFVPDEDPLLFYRAIARYGLSALVSGGWLYFEMNPIYAQPLNEMLNMMSYRDIEIRTDLYGKQRMIRARL